jgi:hypothetical protein
MTPVWAVAILIFLFALGWPVSRWWLRDRETGMALALAPHCGLLVLVLIVANAYFLNVAVGRMVWPVTALAAAAGLWGLWRWRKARAAGIPVLLLGATLGVYSLPFLRDPDLVCFAHAGTDGNAYINTAGYQITHGERERPEPDVYHVYTGLIRYYSQFADGWVEKPGTNVTLAFFSSLLGRLPHEVFSPLMLAFTALAYLGTLALARRLGFGWGTAGVAGFAAAASPSLLSLASNTYFSATATYGMFPALLAAADDAVRRRRSGAMLAGLYTTYFLLSPQTWLVPPAALGPYLVWSAWREMRRDRRAAWAALGVLAGSFVALNLVSGGLYGGTGRVYRHAFGGTMTLETRRWSWNLFWHTLGVGEIMASPATKLDGLAWLALGCVLALAMYYVVDSVWRRDFSVVWFAYLGFWLMVLVGGAGQRFRAVEILSRVAQQFGPLHPLVYLTLARQPGRPVVGLVAALAILQQYRPFVEFEKVSLVLSPQRSNQHFRSTLREREEIRRVVGEATVLADSRLPTLTALANVVSLFSNLRLAIPPQYLQFFFLQNAPRPREYLCATYVLIFQYFPDIQPPEGPGTVYEGRWFRVRRNERFLIFDNETFPVHHDLAPWRELNGDTVVSLCSQKPATVRLRIRYAPLRDGQRVFQVAGGRVTFSSGEQVETPALRLEPGTNNLAWKPLDQTAEKVRILEITVMEN